MKMNVIFKRAKYTHAMNFPGQLEVRVIVGRKIFHLTEGVALVWPLIDGKRDVQEIHQCLGRFMSLVSVEASLAELYKLKLIRKSYRHRND